MITGSISGKTLTVTALQTGGLLSIGETLSGNETPGAVVSGTTITGQLTGSAGDLGTYTVSVSQTVSSQALTASRTNLELYNSVAYDNVIIDESANVHGNASGMRGCSNCAFFNNVFMNGEQLFISTGSEPGFLPISQTINPTFTNNIFYGNGGPATSGFFGFAGSYTGTLTVDHNDFFNYASAIPAQTNAITGNPLFVNNTSDWHLQTGSPALSAGVVASQSAYGGGTIDVSHDYKGVARTVPWDLGIYDMSAAVRRQSI